MPTGWQGSTRRASLPKGWWRIRWRVLERDQHQCQIRTAEMCTGRATEVDHIGARDDHDPAQLRAACSACHRHRSSQQGGAAYGRAARARVAARRRPAEVHPGAMQQPARRT